MWDPTLRYAPSDYGGQGGTSNRTHFPFGAGNPGSSPSGNSGTGGLLVVYASNVDMNSGSLKAVGTSGLYVWTGGNCSSGGSGGGSINLFYNSLVKKPTCNVVGGGRPSSDTDKRWCGGVGGLGSVSIGSIATGTYVEYTE